MTVEERRRRRFSEEFKRSIVLQLEKGEITVKDVSILCEVKMASVKLWLGKYGKTSDSKTNLINPIDETSTLKDLKEEYKQLNSQIADGRAELHITKTILKFYQDRFGTELEKKASKS